jgi:hypothetical protein
MFSSLSTTSHTISIASQWLDSSQDQQTTTADASRKKKTKQKTIPLVHISRRQKQTSSFAASLGLQGLSFHTLMCSVFLCFVNQYLA